MSKILTFVRRIFYSSRQLDNDQEPGLLAPSPSTQSSVSLEPGTAATDDGVQTISSDLSPFKKFLHFVGPGYMVAVGYMDPGNWATDIGGGAEFGYTLLFIVLISSFMAMLFQCLCIRLGVVTGRDLAEQCRHAFHPKLNWALYALAEVGIIATDLAEVIGSAIALNLLFGIPLVWGVVITALDVIIILRWWGTSFSRWYELIIIALVLTVGILFTAQLFYTKPNFIEVLIGYLPSLSIVTNQQTLFVAIGIIGATIMPHNLYLHSSLCKHRRIKFDTPTNNISIGSPHEDRIEMYQLGSDTDDNNSIYSAPKSTVGSSPKFQDVALTIVTPSVPPPSVFNARSRSPTRLPATEQHKIGVSDSHEISIIKQTVNYAMMDVIFALMFAFLINSAILIVGASAFHANGITDVAELQDAYNSLNKTIGHGTGTLFAIALLASGQSSTITGTMAGQIVMSGFLALKLKPWLRRIITRLLAITPAIVVVSIYGEQGLNNLLIWSQVILSCQLPFAVIPLVMFTSMQKYMGGAPRPSFRIWIGRLFRRSKLNQPEQVNNDSTQIPEGHFINGWVILILSVISTIIVTGLNIYLVIAAIIT